MKIKIRFTSLLVLAAVLSINGFALAKKEVTLFIPPAQIRMPEGLLLPSSNTLVRSNHADEFTDQDADSSVIYHVISQQADSEVLEKEGLIVHDSKPSDVSPESISAEAENFSLQEEIDVINAETLVQPLSEKDVQQESQWIINTEENDFLSIESEEAKDLITFIKNICRDSNATIRMSLSGRDILTFVAIARRYNFESAVLKSCLRIFYNKFKGCLLVDDVVLHQILPDLSNLLEPYLDTEKNASVAISAIQKDVEELMCECFLKYSHILTTRPNDFCTKISRSLARAAYMSLEGDESKHARLCHARERLRFLMIQFLNLLLDRVVWPPHAFESIWPSFMKIGGYICQFAEKGIVTHMGDLNDLVSTLVYRFVFYINLHANVLPPDFFRVIQNELSSGAVFFLEYPEHAEMKKFLEDEINATYLKAEALQKMAQFNSL
jgi:hypothetical protein